MWTREALCSAATDMFELLRSAVQHCAVTPISDISFPHHETEQWRHSWFMIWGISSWMVHWKGTLKAATSLHWKRIVGHEQHERGWFGHPAPETGQE